MTDQHNYNLDWLISVDDHVIEPPDVWSSRLPRNLVDAGPRMVRDDDGSEAWHYDGKKISTLGLSACAGKSRKEFSYTPLAYSEMRPGCYDSAARVEDMDHAGILASLCFPTFPRFCGQIFWEASDRKLALLCVKAYNDWMIDEWCGSAPGRFVPLIILPLWDPIEAAHEIERCVDRGVRAVAFSENFEPLGLPTINDPNGYWDPVFQVCNDSGVVVCMHIGSSSQMFKYTSDSIRMVDMAWGAGSRLSGTMLDWLFSDVFDRFPKLKIALSEGGIGWMPYFLERAADVFQKQRYWAAKGDSEVDLMTGAVTVNEARRLNAEGFDVMARFRDHVYGCFIYDPVGVKLIHDIGIDNVMIETDYPHSDSTWPDCISGARAQLNAGHLTDEEKFKVLRGNAERVFDFTPAKITPEMNAANAMLQSV